MLAKHWAQLRCTPIILVYRQLAGLNKLQWLKFSHPQTWMSNKQLMHASNKQRKGRFETRLWSEAACMHATSYRALSYMWYSTGSNKGLGSTVTLPVGMQSPQKEIYDICKPLLTTRSLSDVEKVVSKVFTDDAVFTHAFIISKGKESIVRTYQFWKLINKQIGFDIENAGKQAPQSGNFACKRHPDIVTFVSCILISVLQPALQLCKWKSSTICCLKIMRQLVPDSVPWLKYFSLCTTVLSDKGDLLVLVNFKSHEYPWFWPFSFPAMKLHYDIKLKVVDTPQGKKFATQVCLDRQRHVHQHALPEHSKLPNLKSLWTIAVGNLLFLLGYESANLNLFFP